jgi:hypothetical protein
MPVDVRSRYRLLPSYTVVDRRGTTTALPERPLVPITDADADLYNHRLTGVETLEYLAWRYFGDSNAWWYIADANPLTFPLDHRPGTTIKIARGSEVGRVVRTRGR